MASAHSPQFRSVLKSISDGNVLAPAIRAYLHDPQFKGFTVRVGGMGKRDPDGWFHPSTHPTWSERSLYLYLTDHTLLNVDPMNPMAVLSMTIGTIWHSIIGEILTKAGVVTDTEVRVKDDDSKTRGSMDGVMPSGEIYELKTMKEFALTKINSVEDYLSKYPTYHLQANEYMRMSGLRSERVLLMALTFPYEMREFVIPYDEELGEQTKAKYQRVLQAVADQRMPFCEGCAPTKECPSRALCDHLFREAK